MNGPALHEEHSGSLRKTWAILAGIAVGFLLWGLFLFFTLGDKGPPDWQYSVIPDVPGQSVYSTQEGEAPRGILARPGREEPVEEQHVMGPPRENPDVHRPGQKKPETLP